MCVLKLPRSRNPVFLHKNLKQRDFAQRDVITSSNPLHFVEQARVAH